MFINLKNLISIDVSGWNTFNMNSLTGTFSGCTSLNKIVGLDTWDVSNVTLMSRTFNDCSSLTNLDGISNWNVSSVFNLENAFKGCESLNSLNVSNWETSKVRFLGHTFYGLSLQTIDLSDWNVSNVTTMSNMFVNADNFILLNAKNWDTSKVTNNLKMFYRAATNYGDRKLLVITKDKKLKEYDYESDNRIPSGPIFKANGGKFSGNEVEKQAPIFVIEGFDDNDINKALEEEKNSMEIPTYVGYTFVNWVKTPYDKPNDILEVWDKLNAEYIVEWIINSYTLTYDMQDGNTQNEQVEFDSVIQKPKDPVRNGYTFGGWYKEADCQNAWDFTSGKMPAGNMTLYAKWNINSYNVTFDSQEGSSVPGGTVNFDELVVKPQDPTREGYTFGGWYTDTNYITAWNFDSNKMP